MEGSLIALGVLVVVALSGRQLVTVYRRRTRWHAIKSAKPVAIASLPPGELAKITGTIAPRGALLTSPIHSQECIGYCVALETLTGDRPWQRVLNSAECSSFYVTDESGTALVEEPIVIVRPSGAAWETPPRSAWPRVKGERIRCQEMLLRPGDQVSVLGRATMEIDPAGRGSYREPPMLPHMRGSDKDPIIVANADELQVF